jgi:hypothetical protein
VDDFMDTLRIRGVIGNFWTPDATHSWHDNDSGSIRQIFCLRKSNHLYVVPSKDKEGNIASLVLFLVFWKVQS